MDCSKKYTIKDFKVWAARQSGFNFQPAPGWEKTTYDKGAIVIYNDLYYESLEDDNHDVPTEVTWQEVEKTDGAVQWVAPKFYNVGDRVIALDMQTFKFALYESQEDNNYDDPTTATDTGESDDADLTDVLLDSDIEEAMTEARFKFNPALFANEAECKTAFSLLTAFFVAYDKQMSASGINGGYKGLTASKRIGEMSLSYIPDPAIAKGSQAASFFYANPYGKKYFNLVQSRLKAATLALGRSTNI